MTRLCAMRSRRGCCTVYGSFRASRAKTHFACTPSCRNIPKMRDDQSYNIFFVNVVEKHTVLYNFNEPLYQNKQEMDKTWKAVAEEINEKLNDSVTGEECRNRWRVLRQSFVRYTFHSKGEGSRLAKKPYYLEDAMKFILRFTRPLKPRSCGRFSAISNSESSFSHVDADEINEDQSFSMKEETVEDNFSRPASVEASAVDDCLESDVEDKEFLKSCLAELKCLNAWEKVDFKKDILTIISNKYRRRLSTAESATTGASNTSPDQFQIFGDFIASELRSLKHEKNVKKLKKIIQQNIIEVSESEESGDMECVENIITFPPAVKFEIPPPTVTTVYRKLKP